ncbi:D-alanine-D-alanine ligase [Laceyella sediminis]|uniref:D-alanine--D-alanine ligase n=1 Tax=Laceyella sediminis TaxID=573074 RepID=A0ABX5EQS7_9BACL|nr:D-alanine--D-alanine ligase [Laceyella sediminis]PRZ15873.1 D-alanine-D-alanine ligase [Laceyella sediminis]
MSKKLRVAVLFGGKSGEHEVSLASASSVMKAMDHKKYDIIPIGITQEGSFLLGQAALPMLEGKAEQAEINRLQQMMPAVTTGTHALPAFQREEIDVVFPVLHGTYGEDGTIQGFLEIANIPYVGAGVLASSVGMDKAVSKKVFAEAGLPQANYVSFLKADLVRNQEAVLARIEKELGYPCFVKPANLGSSVGISKARNREELIEALALASAYDRKIVVEEFVPAHEVEVAVLGNDEPEASVPGEIVSSNEFYDYKAKYIDGKSVMRIPAELPQDTAEQLREMAIRAFKAIDGSGLARVDFFIRKDTGEILLNEINTMPGFTQFSMYAKLWEHSGLTYAELVDKLIQLALERYEEKSQLRTDFAAE